MPIVQFQFKQGTSAEWLAADPVLAAGEPGVDVTTGGFKIGNGVKKWSELSFQGYDLNQLTALVNQIGDAQSAIAAAQDATNAANTAVASVNAALSTMDETARDAVGAALVAGTNVSIAVDDTANTITISATGGTTVDQEVVRDTIGSALVAGTGIAIAVNDTANTITISNTGGTGGTIDAEAVRDTIGAALVAGQNIQITVNDTGDTITLASNIDAALRSADANAFYTTSWPTRASVTTDTARRVNWVGPTSPPTTTGYALANDVWEPTT